jgi:hypothetical protein
MIEYDQGYFHTDVARDLKKTQRLLAEHPTAHVVRLRVNTQGNNLLLPNSDRFAQLVTSSASPFEQARIVDANIRTKSVPTGPIGSANCHRHQQTARGQPLLPQSSTCS